MSNPQANSAKHTEADTPAQASPQAQHPGVRGLHLVAASMVLLMGSGFAPPAQAVDGCLVLLCLAAPSWRAIPQCVPPIRELLRDLARGRAFPSCGMSGAGNGAAHQWAMAPSLCPPQYTLVTDGPNGPIYSCLYSGVISVSIRGEDWSRTWWSLDGGSVTDYSATAKQQMGQWDSQFDEDYARWLASQPPPPACTDC